MLRILGPVFDVDCEFKEKCKGQGPADPDDVARLLAVKLSRCLLLDHAGVEDLLFHAVSVTTEELKQAGISRLHGSDEMSLSVLFPSIAGFVQNGEKVESRFAILTKPTLNKRSMTIAGFASLTDAREILDRVAKKAKASGN